MALKDANRKQLANLVSCDEGSGKTYKHAHNGRAGDPARGASISVGKGRDIDELERCVLVREHGCGLVGGLWSLRGWEYGVCDGGEGVFDDGAE